MAKFDGCGTTGAVPTVSTINRRGNNNKSEANQKQKRGDAAADINVEDCGNSVWGLVTVGPLLWPSQ